jgi:hypothetical protein
MKVPGFRRVAASGNVRQFQYPAREPDFPSVLGYGSFASAIFLVCAAR